MKTRIIASAIIIPVSLAILIFLPPFVLAITVAVIVSISAFELLKAVSKTYDDTAKKQPSSRAAVYASIAAAMMPLAVFVSMLFAVAAYAQHPQSAPNAATALLAASNMNLFGLAVVFILVCLLFIDVLLTFKSPKRIRPKQYLAIPIAALVIPLMLSSLIGLKMLPSGRLLVMIPIIVTVFADSGAYFIGITMGKRKPFPKISPNKTVAGCVGALISGAGGLLLYGIALDYITELTISYPLLVVYGIIGAVITIAGDLAFSSVKRKCGIKDYGNLIPGHGGMLDRFDGMIFCAPSMYLLVLTIPAIG